MSLPFPIRFLGQKVAAFERNRPYAVRGRVFRFAPLPSADHERELVILCEPRTFSDGCWSAWSWHRFLRDKLRLRLLVDGTVTTEQRASFLQLFPGATVESLPELLEKRHRPSPAFARFLTHYPYARKLALLTTLQLDGDFVYSDADILAFREPRVIRDALDQPGHCGLFMEEPGCYCVDPWVAEEAARLGLPRHNDLNSGLLFIRRGSLDLASMEKILESWTPEVFHRVAEQTIIGVLMAMNGAAALPAEDYVVSNSGMFFWQRDEIDPARITARHYVGNVRHLLYREGLPALWKTTRGKSPHPALDSAAPAAH